MQDLSIEQIKVLKLLPASTMQDEIKYLQPKLLDKLFLQTGIEQEELTRAVEELKLEEDPEY